jgi:hypothetical protein
MSLWLTIYYLGESLSLSLSLSLYKLAGVASIPVACFFGKK